MIINHDDAIKWQHFPRYWPFVRGIQRSPVDSRHKDQWHGALMFSLICAWTNDWENTRGIWRFETPSRLLWRHRNGDSIYPAKSRRWDWLNDISLKVKVTIYFPIIYYLVGGSAWNMRNHRTHCPMNKYLYQFELRWFFGYWNKVRNKELVNNLCSAVKKRVWCAMLLSLAWAYIHLYKAFC